MSTTTVRVRAPDLSGAGGWINTNQPLQLAELRGRAVLLDFWTFCCINCLRVIEELRPLERRFGDRLVVIGVHSPKFPHEGDHAAVEQAVRRHRVEHPVLDDPEMETWQRYGVRAWPTLVLVDPDGYLAAMVSGEGNAEALAAVIEGALAGRETPSVPAFRHAGAAGDGELSFPGKVCSDGGGRLAVADTGNDRVIVLSEEGDVELIVDGFAQPEGLRFDDRRLLVCDTVGGALVAVDLDGQRRTTLCAGLRSPWDVAVLADGSLAVAEAGSHRLVRVPRDGGEPDVLAGTGAEGLRDGPAGLAHLAQPSGLAALADGALAIADSEVSALRVLRDGRVETLVGRGLFEWGNADGEGGGARLQHPLGVAALGDGAIAVADTFNSRLALWRDGRLTTVALSDALDEPGGLEALPDGRVVVADTNHHRLVAVDLTSGEATVLLPRPARRVRAPAGGELALELRIDGGRPPLDRTVGPPVRVSITAEPPELLRPGPRVWALDEIPAHLSVPVAGGGGGALTVEVVAATCDGDLCTLRRYRRAFAVEVG